MDNVKLICACCNKRILKHSKILTCAICTEKYHIKCVQISGIEFHDMNHSNDWYCSYCTKEIFPCNFLDDDYAFLEALHDMN